MFQTKVVEKIKTHILYFVTFFLNLTVCEIMWKNNAERGRPQITVWRMRIFVSGADPMRNVSWILFQKGRSSELRLRRGVEQAAHTLNPQVEYTGVLLCVIRE